MPVELVIFDYGGVISERLLDDLTVFEERMGYPPGSVHRLLFGEIPPGSDGDPVDGAYDDGPVHDFHLLETGDLGFDEYLERPRRAARPRSSASALGADAFVEFTAGDGHARAVADRARDPAAAATRASRSRCSRTT